MSALFLKRRLMLESFHCNNESPKTSSTDNNQVPSKIELLGSGELVSPRTDVLIKPSSKRGAPSLKKRKKTNNAHHEATGNKRRKSATRRVSLDTAPQSSFPEQQEGPTMEDVEKETISAVVASYLATKKKQAEAQAQQTKARQAQPTTTKKTTKRRRTSKKAAQPPRASSSATKANTTRKLQQHPQASVDTLEDACNVLLFPQLQLQKRQHDEDAKRSLDEAFRVFLMEEDDWDLTQ